MYLQIEKLALSLKLLGSSNQYNASGDIYALVAIDDVVFLLSCPSKISTKFEN